MTLMKRMLPTGCLMRPVFVSLVLFWKQKRIGFVLETEKKASTNNPKSSQKEIEHGIKNIQHEISQKEVAEKKIGVELCPTSNLQTKAVTDFTDYPFREFYDAGILLSINTDNRTVSDTSCTDEYMRLAEAGMFQEPMCEKIYMASLHSAFADDDTKQVLWKKWMSMFDL